MIPAALAFAGIIFTGWLLTLINDSLARESARHYRRVANLRRIAERERP
jgi:hypothetical protein